MRIPALGPRGEGWVVLQTTAFLATAAAAVSGPYWHHTGFRIAGWILIAAGLALVTAGRWALKESFTVLPRPHGRAAFRSGGIYRYVRHPMYGGLLLLMPGIALIRSWVVFIPIAALALIFTLKSMREEDWLTERYPEYAEYRRATRRRFIPFVL